MKREEWKQEVFECIYRKLDSSGVKTLDDPRIEQEFQKSFADYEIKLLTYVRQEKNPGEKLYISRNRATKNVDQSFDLFMEFISDKMNSRISSEEQDRRNRLRYENELLH